MHSMSEGCGTMTTGQPIILLQTDELVTFEDIPFHSSQRCNCLQNYKIGSLGGSKFATKSYNNQHKHVNPRNRSLTRARQTSASDVADLQPSGLFFQSSHVHAGQHKNVDNTLLINGASALEKQRKTQLLWNELRSLCLITHRSICDNQTFKVKRQTAKLQMS